MTTPESLGFVLPTGTDLISQGDNVIATNATASAAMYDALFALRFKKGVLGSTEYPNADSAPDGVIEVTNGAGGLAAGFPFNEQGFILTVTHGASRSQWAFSFSGRIKQRGKGGSVWDAQWFEPSRWHPALTSATPLDSLTTPGHHPMPYSTNPGGVGTSGTVLVLDAGHPTINFVSQLIISADGAGLFWRSARWNKTPPSDPVWSAWSEIGAVADTMDTGAANHAALLSEGRRKRGGKLGTGGASVASIRIDHHTGPFKQYVVALLKKYGMPWGMVYNSASPFADDNVSAAELSDMLINNGGEMGNHGRNHGDAATIPAIRREVVQSLTELKAAYPAFSLDWYAPPGTGSTGFGGAGGFDKPADFSSIAGRMILANHAFVSGYMGSHYRPLGGDPSIGHSHYTMDTATFNHWKSAIDRAIASGTGIAFMLHPSALVDGTTTVSALDQAFAYMADKRDAGELLVLSPTASLIADAGSNFRRNLLGKTTLAAAETVTLNLTSAGGSYPVDFRGAVHELVVDGVSTLTVTSDVGGLNATVTNLLPGIKTRLVFYVPITCNTVTVTSTNAVTNAILTAV